MPATRENARKSYQEAVRHFEAEWGGFLPAAADPFSKARIGRTLAVRPSLSSIE